MHRGYNVGDSRRVVATILAQPEFRVKIDDRVQLFAREAVVPREHRVEPTESVPMLLVIDH